MTQWRDYVNKVRKNRLALALCLFVAWVVIIFIWRYIDYANLRRQTIAMAIPVVRTIHAKPTAATEHIYLPGMALAWHQAPIFARTKGYLKEWYVDIGWRVKKGDLLAVIERPELDAQFYEAKAYLNVVAAQNDLAQITARRWNTLVKTDSVSKQANDNKTYEAQALAAELVKARANLARLTAWVEFERIVAPFDGTISLRQTDIGQLINIGSNPAEAQPLFILVQMDRLRLYVNIPQTYSTQIPVDAEVFMHFAELPGQTFGAKLLKTADAIDPITLTLQAEFEVQNPQGILKPGSYTMVEFAIPSHVDSVILPVNTLIFQAAGLQVATLDKDNRVVIKNVEMGIDYGDTVQINSGLRPGEPIIINPIDSLYHGQLVRVIDLSAQKTA